YLTHEFGVGDFDCQLSVSDAIEADGINASYERGVLTIRLPKRDEIKPRRIPVRDAQGTQ
ncbi:MAG: Hsp20/alpha crystallin family protein, partial [Planctomycetota bacterium]